MKYIKTVIWVACFPFFLMSCDSDDGTSVNSTSAIVEFQESQMTVKESTQFVTIPIIIDSEGQRNGDVSFRVTMKENDGSLKLNRDVILTTENYRIPAGVNSINFEVALNVNNKEPELGRFIIFQIEELTGAKAGTKSECKLNLTEINFIEGIYQLRGSNPIQEEWVEGSMNITTQDHTMNQVFLDFGLGNPVPLHFEEVIPNRLYKVTIEPNALAGQYNGNDVFMATFTYNMKNNSITYEPDKPINILFEIKEKESGEELLFTFLDGFGLMSLDEEGNAEWYEYDVYLRMATATKDN